MLDCWEGTFIALSQTNGEIKSLCFGKRNLKVISLSSSILKAKGTSCVVTLKTITNSGNVSYNYRRRLSRFLKLIQRKIGRNKELFFASATYKLWDFVPLDCQKDRLVRILKIPAHI
jgi:hypothetical protein